jgi:NAD(P)-dependent dehydrogenase (short-subunit alcohol dehydrogenase family)
MPNAKAHIIVVGGTSGIGLAVARAAAKAGCEVTVAGRDGARATAVATSIGPAATGVGLDLWDSGSIRAALSEGPAIDHLVITAIERSAAGVRDFDPESAARLARMKLVGYAEVVHHALPRMSHSSSVVLFGGLAKTKPYPGSLMVSAVNGGVAGLTAALAFQLAPIRVNGISPGVVPDTPAWERFVEKNGRAYLDQLTARTPARYLPTTQDIVHAVFFLLDNKAVNAIDLQVDGGIQVT